jgi:hypothetical protein
MKSTLSAPVLASFVVACLPVRIAGRNRMMRKMIMDSTIA